MSNRLLAGPASAAPANPALSGGPDRVRVAEMDDSIAILDLLDEMHVENGQFKMSRPKVIETLNEVFVDGRGLIGTIGARDNLQASVCLMFGQVWYSDEWVLIERWSYVPPQYRQSTNAKDLISFAKWASDGLNMPLVMSVVSHEKTEAKVRLFQRQLGQPFGAIFIHNLEARA